MFRSYNPYVGGSKPSSFIVFGPNPPPKKSYQKDKNTMDARNTSEGVY